MTRARHKISPAQPQNPLSKFLSDAQFKFTVTRGPLNVAGQPGALIVTTPLTGTFEALGTLTGAASSGVSAVGGALGNLLGGNVGQQVENLAGKAFDQHTDIQGTVTTTARPTIAPNWRLAPNLAAQVNVVDVVLPIGGLKLSVGNAVKPVLDKLVHDQTDALEAYLRSDPFIETAARAEWAKLCRAIPLGAGGQGMPNLFLEIRPMRAIAAQPKIDAKAVTLLVGVQAQTRIVPQRDQADCPFPQQLDHRAAGERGYGQHRGSDRHSVHRTEPPPRDAGRGQDVSRGRPRRIRDKDQTGRHLGVRRPPADFARGQRHESAASSVSSAPTPP